MFLHYRTQGLILKKIDWGEADQLFTIYTEDFGKLEILGKGIRKITSKLRSGVEIFYLSEIEFIQGKTHKILTDALLIEKFGNLRKSLKKLTLAYKISETLDNLIQGQESDKKIWQLLLEVFKKLDNFQLTTNNLQLIYYYFFWNLLSLLGYQPELYYCVLCQKKLIPQRLYFDFKEGGIICNSCSQKIKEREIREIEIDTIKILRILLKRDWLILKKLKIDSRIQKSLKEISKTYFSYLQSNL